MCLSRIIRPRKFCREREEKKWLVDMRKGIEETGRMKRMRWYRAFLTTEPQVPAFSGLKVPRSTDAPRRNCSPFGSVFHVQLYMNGPWFMS